MFDSGEANQFSKGMARLKAVCACPRVSRLHDTLPTQRAQIPAVLKRKYKTAEVGSLFEKHIVVMDKRANLFLADRIVGFL